MISRTTLSPMAMDKGNRHAKQTSMWVTTQDLPCTAGHRGSDRDRDPEKEGVAIAAAGVPHSGCTRQCLGQVAHREGDHQFHRDDPLPKGKPEHQPRARRRARCRARWPLRCLIALTPTPAACIRRSADAPLCSGCNLFPSARFVPCRLCPSPPVPVTPLSARRADPPGWLAAQARSSRSGR